MQKQQQQMAYQPPSMMQQETREEEPVEPEFNLEDFLKPGIFTTTPDPSGQSILDELVTFQSNGPITVRTNEAFFLFFHLFLRALID